ncbi:exopolysaccharide Pel transporter PelG [Bacillus mycoides]
MWRSMFTPIIQILQIDFPELDLIHSVSTGYGGLLGAAISAKSDIPFILTEHGIYSREREEEILQSTWIPIEYKKRWISFFHHLSHQAYEQAADVITLFGRNSAYQKELGAPAHKLKIIPNGVTLSDYKGLRKPKYNSDKLIISAIIRVVPIKDVKIMIYAAKLLLEKDIPFIFYLLGLDTEEAEYAQECRDLIQQLGLEEHVIMTGKVNIKDYLKQTDILVLTSISEGQPLALYYKIVMLFLFLALNIIWIQSIYLTTAKDYQSIALAFLIGSIFSLSGIALIAYWHPTLGIEHGLALLLLISFTIGTFITLVWLSIVIVRMFPNSDATEQFTFLSYLDKYPELFWSSLLYNIGIWVCNFVIWFGEGRGNIENTFIYHQIYDTSVFWAYLSIIPIYIFFVVSIETRFYERYKKFFGSVNNGATLNTILQLKESMNFVLKQEMERIPRNQGIFSLLIIFIIWMFSSQSGNVTLEYSILQLTIIGAYANGMVLVITLLLLYFEDRKGAFRTSALFFSANLLLSLLLLPFGFNGYGISFALGSSITFLYAISRLFTYIKDIDYYTFCQSNTPIKRRTFFTKFANKLNGNK